MKNRSATPPFLILACFSFLAALSAQAESIWLNSWVTLEAGNVHQEGQSAHRLKVHYLLPVDHESFDGRDIWVVSLTGFNQLAKFEGAERILGPHWPDGNLPFDDALLEAGVIPGQWHEPDYVTWIATYSISAEDDQGWIAEDNGRYAVLLQPGEVAYANGTGYLPAQYLGSFRIAIGEPEPALPDEFMLSVRPTDAGPYVAGVLLGYKDGNVEVRSWGEVNRHGSRLVVDIDAVRVENDAEAPVTFEHDYRLPELEPGAYSFSVLMGDELLGTEAFRVPGGDDPVPADVKLEVFHEDTGRHVAHVTVHLLDPYFVISDWGEPVLEGNQFTIKATAERVVFVRPPDEPAISEHRYDLGFLRPGHYTLAFKLGSEVCPHIEFVVGDPDPNRIPADARIDIVRADAGVFADVRVEIHPNDDGSIYQIGDWGEARLDGHTFYLNAKANGPLESVNVDPIVQEHRYTLFPHGNGGGGGDDGQWESIDFRSLELIPAFLIPERPQEVVFRSAEEWNRWVSEHWPPLILAPAPGPPVDFEKETVLAVFSGHVSLGVRVQIEGVQTNGDIVEAHYVKTIPGVATDGDIIVRTGHMVAIPKTDLPVEFRGDEIVLPEPPPFEGENDDPDRREDPVGQEIDNEGVNENGEIEEGDGNGDPAIPAGEYKVVFLIDGVAYADASFVIEEEDDPNLIPARVELQAVKEDGDWFAQADVYFTGFPYHSIDDWGEPVRQDDNTFLIDATAVRVEFFVEPELPYLESHRYFLFEEPDDDPGNEIDFTLVESSITIADAQKRVIKTIEDWYDLIGFVPGPNVRPISPPVDLEEHTLIVVALGESPNGCYDVRITEMFEAEGVLHVVYEPRYPLEGEACPEVITYPTAMAAIAKTDLPVEFVEVGADGGFGPDGVKIDRVGATYHVVFRINGLVYARTSFVVGDGEPEPPQPGPLPFARLAVTTDGADATVSATLDLSHMDAPQVVTSWGESQAEEYVFRANITTDFPGDEEPGDTVVEHQYHLTGLEPGSYLFVLQLNGQAVARTAFVIRSDDQINDFLHWLEQALAGVGLGIGTGAEADAGFWIGRMDNPKNLDGDRWNDFAEFLLGLSPVNPSDRPMVEPHWIAGEGEGEGAHLAIRFHRRVDANAHADFVVEASQNLVDWVRDDSLFELVDVQALAEAEGMEEVTVCLKAGADVSPFRFLRLAVEERE